MILLFLYASCSNKDNQEVPNKKLSQADIVNLLLDNASKKSSNILSFKKIEDNASEALDICNPGDDPNLPSNNCWIFFETNTFSIPALYSCPACNSAVFSYRYKLCLLPNNTVQFIVFDVRFEEHQSNCSQAFWDCYSNLSPTDYLIWIEQMKQFVAYEIEKDLAQRFTSFIPNCNSGLLATQSKYQSTKCWRVCVPPVPVPPVPYVVENCGHMCCTETRTVCKNPITGEFEWSSPTYTTTNINACGNVTPVCGNSTPCYVLTCGEIISIE